jgi:flagellar basal body-associated protein FliL
MKIKATILILLLIVIAIGIYFYTYKGHRDIAAEKESYAIAVTEIFKEFQSNEVTANSKYLNKTIAVSGDLSNVDVATKSIVINEKLFATFKELPPKKLQLHTKIKIKGRFIGYDALVEELKMDQCVLVTP